MMTTPTSLTSSATKNKRMRVSSEDSEADSKLATTTTQRSLSPKMDRLAQAAMMVKNGDKRKASRSSSGAINEHLNRKMSTRSSSNKRQKVVKEASTNQTKQPSTPKQVPALPKTKKISSEYDYETTICTATDMLQRRQRSPPLPQSDQSILAFARPMF